MLLAAKPLVEEIKEDLTRRAEAVRQDRGQPPTLAIVRLGEREDDLSYERGVEKRAASLGVEVRVTALPADAPLADVEAAIAAVNEDETIDGCLLFRPLPDHLDEDRVRNLLLTEKDVDGITDASMAGVYSGQQLGYPPCTPEACLALCDHYGIDLKGKRVTIVGRSLVVGKPLAMMCLARHATVTTCHTRTVDLKKRVAEAEVVFVAAGRPELLDTSYFSAGQVVVDVGIHVNDEGRLVGDVKRAEVEPLVESLSPVPGGVGSVTTSLLLRHVVEAAEAKK